MRGKKTKQLLRLLHGDLPTDVARRLHAEMERDPELMDSYLSLERIWTNLELPPPREVPPGFRSRVLARQVEAQSYELHWSGTPFWVRAAAALALTVGLALGTVIGLELQSSEARVYPIAEPSLAEIYWQALAQDDALDLGEVQR